jgi:transcriptional regulator with XRE-family HTH domain
MSTPVDPHVIGEHVRRLRSDRHISVRGFAALTGFSASFISQLENGQVSPSLGSLHKIAEALGVTLGEFFAAAETGHDEFAFVLRGQVTLTLADEQNTLAVGDAVTLPAYSPRLWENRTREVAEILMVSSRAPS